MQAEQARWLTRTEFDEQRAAAKRTARQDGRLAAILSVGLGAVQLVFLRWAEAHMASAPRKVIALSAVLAYLALVSFLLWRMKRNLRVHSPRCHQCGLPLLGMSERIASATGKCDRCGGWVLKQEDR